MGSFHRIDDHPEFNTRMESFTFEPDELGLNKHHLKKMAGKHFDPDWAALRVVDFKEGALQFEVLDFLPLSYEQFFLREVPDVRVKFASDETGMPISVTTVTSSGEYASDFVNSNPRGYEEMEIYPGRNYSPELELY